jgi:hypothetical protein
LEKKNEVCVPFESAQWWCSTFVAVTAAFKKQNPKTLTADKKLKKKKDWENQRKEKVCIENSEGYTMTLEKNKNKNVFFLFLFC